MKTKFKVVLTIIITLCVIGGVFSMTLNAASTTHEAEVSTNSFKYASVDGDYVVFDAKKDAYVEMKNVDSPSDGTLTLTFYYAADNSFPLELKVNGTTVVNNDTISAKSSGTVSYKASMSNGDNNKIRFKIRDAVSGIKLDKVIISDDSSGSSTTIAPTAETTEEPVSDTTSESNTATTGESKDSADSTMGGFASVSKYGVDTTTGGSGGSTVTVSNFNDLKSYAESNDRLVIKVSGTISAPDDHELIKVKSNKTIIGVGSSGKLNKITLSVNGWDVDGESCDADDYGTFTPASNVIIRNLEFKGLADFPDDSNVDPDCIRVENYSHHVWIDHNTFQYGADGATDVKRGADMVTISYNHYVKTKKTALVGHSDNNGNQDRGFLNVTFHHNWFDKTETRTPRLRFGYVHTYNNYYDFTSSALRIGPEGQIYADGNYVASEEGKILRDTENEGSLTWTDTNVWSVDYYGEVGNKLLDADQSVDAPPYSYKLGSAPSSPPAAGIGKIN